MLHMVQRSEHCCGLLEVVSRVTLAGTSSDNKTQCHQFKSETIYHKFLMHLIGALSFVCMTKKQ